MGLSQGIASRQWHLQNSMKGLSQKIHIHRENGWITASDFLQSVEEQSGPVSEQNSLPA